jgi:multiple sugar transport system permease protein
MSIKTEPQGVAVAVRPRGRAGNLFRSDRVAAYIMLAPTTISFLLFLAGPMLAGFGLTFFRWDALSRASFVGLQNYHTLVTDPLVATTLWNTVSFVVPDVALKLVLGLVLAVLVDRFVLAPLRYLFRATVFFPVIISAVAGATIWNWLMNTDIGLINYYLQQLSGLQIPWLDSGDWAMRSLVLVDVWRTLGFYFVVFIAGLQGISRQYYEAAAIDGANALQQFFRITVPLLSPTTFFLLVIALIDGFQFFDLAYVMTQGGPGDATRTLVYYIYDTSFHFFRFGYGSTIAMLLFAIIAVITFLQVKFSNRWVFYH